MTKTAFARKVGVNQATINRIEQGRLNIIIDTLQRLCKKLTYRFDSIEKGLALHCYRTTKCETCHLISRCTTGNFRRIKRWENEGVVDAMLDQLNKSDAMTIRRRTVEHPFGTIKARMGATHFLMKGLKNVQTEMSLSVLAYNLTRMIAIMGVKPLIAAIKMA
jgi:transposase